MLKMHQKLLEDQFSYLSLVKLVHHQSYQNPPVLPSIRGQEPVWVELLAVLKVFRIVGDEGEVGHESRVDWEGEVSDPGDELMER